MLQVVYSKKYRRAIKKYSKSGRFDIKWVEDVVSEIVKGKKLANRHKDHQLIGRLHEYRECHIKPDLLLMYRVDRQNLLLVNLGSHSELFG